MKRNTLAKEAFDWMQSLDLPRKPAQVRFGYFDDMMDSTENSEHTSVAECKEEALKRSFITWINNHKSRYALKMGMLQREVDCAIRIMDMRIKNTFSVLKHFVQHSSLSVSAVQTQILREQGLTMKWIYKRRMYLLYWFVRSKNRRRMRSMWFKRWGHHRNGRNLVTKVHLSKYFVIIFIYVLNPLLAYEYILMDDKSYRVYGCEFGLLKEPPFKSGSAATSGL